MKRYHEDTQRIKRVAELRERCQSLIDTAEEEQRDLSPSEAQEFDQAMDELNRIRKRGGGTYQTRAEALADEMGIPNTIAGGKQGSYGPLHPEPDTADWQSRSGRVTRAIEHGESVREYVESRGGHDDEVARLRPGQILRALALGTTDEVERRALSAGLDTSGGYTVPSILSAAFIDAMRAQSVVSRAGAKVVPLEGETSVATVVSDPVPQWRHESPVRCRRLQTGITCTKSPMTLPLVMMRSSTQEQHF